MFQLQHSLLEYANNPVHRISRTFAQDSARNGRNFRWLFRSQRSFLSYLILSHQLAYHGSNSWMMLSNRITAKSLELNPARQARKRMLKESSDCHPAGCVSPPDRPPLPPPPPAAPGRLFPCTEPPGWLKALCLPSLAACCSAISAHGVGWIGWRVPPGTLRRLPPLRNSCGLQPRSSSGLLTRVVRRSEGSNWTPRLGETASTSRNDHACATSR